MACCPPSPSAMTPKCWLGTCQIHWFLRITLLGCYTNKQRDIPHSLSPHPLIRENAGSGCLPTLVYLLRSGYVT